MKLGLMTDSLAHLPLEQAAVKCRDLGLEQVELGCGNWSSAPHVDLDTLLTCADARRALTGTLADNGLTISALNCSGNPLFPGQKGRENRDVTEKTFRLAQQLGVDTVVMMSGLPGGCPEDRSPTWIVTCWPRETVDILRYQWDEAIAQWQVMARQAEDCGIRRIALEFHGWQLVYNPESFQRLRQAIGPIVGVNLDPSHLFWMGADPLATARALEGAIYHVHIKDARLEKAGAVNTMLETKDVLDIAGRSWNYVTPGSGHSEDWWRSFVDTLRSLGYDGALSIEQEDYTIPLDDALKQASALLHRILGQ